MPSAMKMVGSDALIRRLNFLDLKIKKKIAGAVLNRAATPVLTAARRGAPEQTGLLKKSLVKISRSYRGGEMNLVVIGPESKFKGTGMVDGRPVKRWPAKTAHLVEFGTKPHRQPKHWWFRNTGHPGATAKPFLEPAFESTKAQVEQIIETQLRERIEREA